MTKGKGVTKESKDDFCSNSGTPYGKVLNDQPRQPARFGKMVSEMIDYILTCSHCSLDLKHLNKRFNKTPPTPNPKAEVSSFHPTNVANGLVEAIVTMILDSSKITAVRFQPQVFEFHREIPRRPTLMKSEFVNVVKIKNFYNLRKEELSKFATSHLPPHDLECSSHSASGIKLLPCLAQVWIQMLQIECSL